MTPLYGWGEKHVRVVDYVPDVRFKRKSLISVLGLEGFRASMVFKGTLNSEVFGYYVSEVLAPVLGRVMFWCWMICRCIKLRVCFCRCLVGVWWLFICQSIRLI
jgi:hypothetical protein